MSILPNWGFRNTVHACHSDNTVKLPLKDLSGSKATSVIPFGELIKNYVPQVADNYKYLLKPFLFSGLLQNFYIAKIDYSKSFPLHFGRYLFQFTKEDALNYSNSYEGQFSVDFVVDPIEKTEKEFKARYAETLPEGYPRLHPNSRYYTDKEIESVFETWSENENAIVLVAPGLAGGINEPQLRSVLEKLFKAGKHVLVLNGRGCCRTPITTPHVSTGLDTADLRFLVDFLHKKFPKKQIHLAGFSFGGLIIANYLAEEGENSKVTSAVSVSSPWNLLESSDAISSSLSGKYLFEPAISFYLCNLLKNNKKLLIDSKCEFFDEEDFNKFRKSIKRTIEFDDKYTCKFAGFPSGVSYYLAASPNLRTLKIKTPMLILNSLDDPFISHNFPYLDVRKNPYLYMATSDLGGHYAFVKLNGEFWFTDVISEFVNAFDNIIDKNSKVDDNGYNPKQTRFRDNIILY